MRVKSPRSRRSTALAASVAALLTVGLANSLLPEADATAETVKDLPRPADRAAAASTEDKGEYDARTATTSTGKAVLAKAVAKASGRPPTAALREKLGIQAVVDMDGLTGTVRQLARLDGFLSGQSSAPARTVALNYVRSNAAALGLTAADFDTFTLRRDYVDIVGTHHLSWTQAAGGTHGIRQRPAGERDQGWSRPLRWRLTGVRPGRSTRRRHRGHVVQGCHRCLPD